jgi:very-short-patch-repair endonuclease
VAPDEASCWHDDVAAVQDLAAAGLSSQTVRRRVAQGRWQRMGPYAVCRTTGTPTLMQWIRAAAAHGGTGAAISHSTAGTFWGFCAAPAAPLVVVHVTVSHGNHRRSTERIIVHQSRRACTPRFVDGLMVTPPPRTAMDMALGLPDLSAVDALFGKALQTRRVTVEELSDELSLAPSRGSRLPRLAVAEVAMGSRSAAEAQFVRLVRLAQLPVPELNAPVPTSLGTFHVDALWRHLGKGVEIDGRAYHLGAASWQSDLGRQNAIQTTGIVLLRIAARRLWTEPDVVIAEIRAFLGC